MSTTFGVSLENKTRLVRKKKIGRENLGLRNSAFLVAQLSYPCLVLKFYLYKLILNGITENRWCTSFYFVGFDYVREM